MTTPRSRTPDLDRPAPARSARARSATAGAVAAGASLAAAHLGGRLLDGAADPVVAVGRQVIDRTPGPVRESVIGGVGTADKPLLVVGTTVVVLVLGAAVGLLHRRDRRMALGAVAGLWTLGALAVAAVPGATAPAAVLLAAGAGLLGVLVLDLLLGPGRHRPAGEPPPDAAAAAAGSTRRGFLVRAGAVLTVSTAAVVAGGALATRTAGGLAGRLPVPRRRAARPPDGDPPIPGRTPLVTSNAALYRIDTALQTPLVDPRTWRLTISGLVDRPLTFSYDDLARMPQVEAWITLGCVGNEVGGDLVGTPLWQGVRLADLLRAAGVQPAATQLVGRSVDGYTGAFPAALALDGRDGLVAVGMNGEVLPVEHGYPARLVVPGLYGYESAVKWITDLQLADDSYRAYWVRRGYARYAEFRTQSRIDVPLSGSTLPAGSVVVAGMAWAPHRCIQRVEVQVDDGAWTAARLDADSLGPDAWRPWSAELDLTPGPHTLAVRATDGRGQTQPAEPRDVLPDGATGLHRVDVQVS